MTWYDRTLIFDSYMVKRHKCNKRLSVCLSVAEHVDCVKTVQDRYSSAAASSLKCFQTNVLRPLCWTRASCIDNHLNANFCAICHRRAVISTAKLCNHVVRNYETARESEVVPIETQLITFLNSSQCKVSLCHGLSEIPVASFLRQRLTTDLRYP